MKVLSEFQPEPWSRKVRCKGCRADLLVEPADVKQKNYLSAAEWAKASRDVRKDGNVYYAVACPVCGSEKVLYFSAFLPDAVWQAVYGKKPKQPAKPCGCSCSCA